MKPATRSWKQTRFDVTNLQLTFHEKDTKTIRVKGKSVKCVVVEPDIDYYKDLVSHGLLEVLPHLLTQREKAIRDRITACAGRRPNWKAFSPISIR